MKCRVASGIGTFECIDLMSTIDLCCECFGFDDLNAENIRRICSGIQHVDRVSKSLYFGID
jgi:hypothetical protein